MQIRYKGPLRAVEIAATGQVVKQGETVDVADEIAESLLDQADAWAKPSPKSKTAKEG